MTILAAVLSALCLVAVLAVGFSVLRRQANADDTNGEAAKQSLALGADRDAVQPAELAGSDLESLNRRVLESTPDLFRLGFFIPGDSAPLVVASYSYAPESFARAENEPAVQPLLAIARPFLEGAALYAESIGRSLAGAHTVEVAFSSTGIAGLMSGELRFMMAGGDALPVLVNAATGKAFEIGRLRGAAALGAMSLSPLGLALAVSAAVAAAVYDLAILNMLNRIDRKVGAISNRLRGDDYGTLRTGVELSDDVVLALARSDLPAQYRLELAHATMEINRVYFSTRAVFERSFSSVPGASLDGDEADPDLDRGLATDENDDAAADDPDVEIAVDLDTDADPDLDLDSDVDVDPELDLYSATSERQRAASRADHPKASDVERAVKGATGDINSAVGETYLFAAAVFARARVRLTRCLVLALDRSPLEAQRQLSALNESFAGDIELLEQNLDRFLNRRLGARQKVWRKLPRTGRALALADKNVRELLEGMTRMQEELDFDGTHEIRIPLVARDEALDTQS